MVDLLPENIKALRESKGMSQKDLADALGKKLNIVQKWEQASRIPSPDALYKLSELFDVEFVIRHAKRHPLHQTTDTASVH